METLPHARPSPEAAPESPPPSSSTDSAAAVLVRFAPAVADEARAVLAEGGISALQAHPAAWPFVVELAAAASAHLLGPSAHTVCWSRLVRATLDPLDLIAHTFDGLSARLRRVTGLT